MAILLKNVTNSIWHAFNALLQEKQGFVNKSKLKVSSNYKKKKKLNKYRYTYFNFTFIINYQFEYIL